MNTDRHGQNNPFWGKKHTEKTKKKIRISQLGHRMSDTSKEKLHIYRTGKTPWNLGKSGGLSSNWKGGNSQSYRYKHGEELAGRKRPKECEVCTTPGVVCFDHDHGDLKFRGWICQHCNIIIGMAKDDPKILDLLAAYLRTHGK